MKKLTENMITEIKEAIILDQITKSDDDKIGYVAEKFSTMFDNEEELISFNQEIGEMVEEMEFQAEIVISDVELIRDYYYADADFTTDFEKNGVCGELYLNLEIREGGREYATCELMETGSQAHEDDFQGVIDWLEANDIDIVWEEK